MILFLTKEKTFSEGSGKVFPLEISSTKQKSLLAAKEAEKMGTYMAEMNIIA